MSSQKLVSLTLFPATRDQILETRRRTHPHWGRGLTLDQYLSREAQLDAFEHAANGKLATWVLAPRDDPEGLNFKCACETFHRKAFVKTPGSDSLEEVVGYGIASVFTPPQYRGKGYARLMMRLLHWVLAPHSSLPPFPEKWGLPPPENSVLGDAKFSILYSDIGPQFYQSAGPDEKIDGWVVRDPIATVWDVPKVVDIKLPESDVLTEWLSEDACEEIWKRDVILMATDLQCSDPKRISFTFLPDAGVSAFLVKRTIFFTPGQSYEVPSKWGVALHGKGEDERSAPVFATWTLDVRPPPSTLVVTRVRATKETFPYLVSCMFLAARESVMDRVEVWNLPKGLEELANSLGAKTEARDEHLNAFKWYGPEKSDDVDWAFNEKFCWC